MTISKTKLLRSVLYGRIQDQALYEYILDMMEKTGEGDGVFMEKLERGLADHRHAIADLTNLAMYFENFDLPPAIASELRDVLHARLHELCMGLGMNDDQHDAIAEAIEKI